MLQSLTRLLFVAMLLYGGHDLWQRRWISYGAGRQVAPSSPQQGVPRRDPIERVGEYQLTRLATYELTARVLGRERYHLDDGAELCPLDLALGWGPMSDDAVINRLDISQDRRFYHYEWQGTPPLPLGQIVSHSANTHIIPADAYVRKVVFGLPEGSVVKLTGDLVEATRPDGWRWTSSLTRADAGRGACELFYVRNAERIREP